MPIIILTHPFIRHYKGSVFQVSDAIGHSDWDEDDRVRDRQPCYDNRVYELPDNGKGMVAELPLEYTVICPDHLLVDVDLKSGPCRITSVSEGLKKTSNDPFYNDPLPLGFGKIWYKSSQNRHNNVLLFDQHLEEKPDTAVIKNHLTHEIVSVILDGYKAMELSLVDFDPGFYAISLMKFNQLLHHFTIIKCFPLVIETTEIRSQYLISKALW